MTREEFITEIKNLKTKIAEDALDDITDYAREQTYYCLEGAIQFLEENEE